jgi:predicted dehydrogenase
VRGDGVTQALRLGVIGVGDVAQRDYLPEIHRLAPEAVVVGVAGARAPRARETAERLGVAAWHVGYRALLEDEGVEALVDLTQAQLHEEVNAAAIEAGLPVYSEKPLALAASGARALGAAAAARGVVLAAAPSVLVFPQVRLVAAELRSGRLGRPVAASAAVFGGVPPWEGYASDPTPYFADEIGPLVDLGVYPLHALTALLGPVRRVSAMSARTRDRFEVADGLAAGTVVPVEAPDLSTLLLEHEGGAVATMHASFASAASSAPELEVLCEGGAVACSLLDPAAPVRVDRGGGWSETAVGAERTSGPDHVLGVRHFVRCVRGTEEPLLTPEHAAHVLDVIEAARRSVADRRAIDVPDEGWSPAAPVTATERRSTA